MRVRSLLSGRLSARRHPRLVRLPVPGHELRVWARPGTSDLAAFDEVFGGGYAVDLPREPDVVFDLGANVGYASVDFALRYPSAHVVAVEPEPTNVALLRRNAAAVGRIDVVEAAVWPTHEPLVLEDVGKGKWGHRVRVAADGAVAAVTIPDLLERAGVDHVDLVKIDIEGSELALFSQATQWIARVGAFMIELHDRYSPGCRETLELALAKSGLRWQESRRGETVVLMQEPAPPR